MVRVEQDNSTDIDRHNSVEILATQKAAEAATWVRSVKHIALRAAFRLRLLSLFTTFTQNTATVFMLHRILDKRVPDGHITPQTFRKFLEYLRRHRFSVLSLREYVRALEEGRSLRKCVVLTFDDGYADFYTLAFPLLREFDFPATVFVATDFIDGKLFYWWDRLELMFSQTAKTSVDLTDLDFGTLDFATLQSHRETLGLLNPFLKEMPAHRREKIMQVFQDRLQVALPPVPTDEFAPFSWDNAREMVDHKIDVLPHTRTHAIMTYLSEDEMYNEAAESKNRIESELSKPADIFCYPCGEVGHFDERTALVLSRAGYRAAMIGVPGFNSTVKKNNMFALNRIAIPHGIDQFAQYVSGLERFKDSLRHGFRKS